MTTTLERTLPELAVAPVYIGPTWTQNPHWSGEHEGDHYLLPEHSLGWHALHWVHANLLHEDSTPERPIPFTPTFEQKRLLLWWYAIDERGRFIYRAGVLQRLKGWGKDPIAAVISAIEFIGPCRFGGWLTKDRPDLGLVVGDPIGKEHPRAWVQIAAVSQEQTTNTMSLFPGLFSEDCKREHGMDKHSIGKTIIYAHGGSRRIQAVTSSFRALEGGRPTFVLMNETHHWIKGNEGLAMASVIRRNAQKAKGGQARSLAITNAYHPAEGSVAQGQREAYEAEVAGLAIPTGMFYDSIEAPRGAKLRPAPIDTGEVDERGKPIMREPTDDEVRDHLATILRAVRGDAIWLDVETIVNGILSGDSPPSESRRFWFNQVVSAEDSWVNHEAVDLSISPMARDNRLVAGDDDVLRAGWIVMPDDPIVMFFDGSKSHDATGLVGCRLSDGYVFTIGVWQNPGAGQAKTWLAPREEVAARGDEAFERFNIVAFWGDPSHAKDAEDDTRYWDGVLDRWHKKYKDRLQLWAVKTGDHQHAITWDMTSPTRTAMFVAAAETFKSEMEHLNDVEEFEPEIVIDGHPALVRHLKNAIESPGQYGISLQKESRESPKKIDLAVCAVGARMLRRLVMLRDEDDDRDKGEKKAGEVWGAWSAR